MLRNSDLLAGHAHGVTSPLYSVAEFFVDDSAAYVVIDPRQPARLNADAVGEALAMAPVGFFVRLLGAGGEVHIPMIPRAAGAAAPQPRVCRGLPLTAGLTAFAKRFSVQAEDRYTGERYCLIPALRNASDGPAGNRRAVTIHSAGLREIHVFLRGPEPASEALPAALYRDHARNLLQIRCVLDLRLQPRERLVGARWQAREGDRELVPFRPAPAESSTVGRLAPAEACLLTSSLFCA